MAQVHFGFEFGPSTGHIGYLVPAMAIENISYIYLTISNTPSDCIDEYDSHSLQVKRHTKGERANDRKGPKIGRIRDGARFKGWDMDGAWAAYPPRPPLFPAYK